MRLIHLLEQIDDEDALYDYPNPLPHMDVENDNWAEWFDRGDKVVQAYLTAHNLTWRENVKAAKSAISQTMRLPINKLLGTEKLLNPSALQRKAGDKFSSARPIIYKVDGIYLITDGNHRVVQAHQEGKTDIDVDVIDVDAFERAAA